MTTTSMLVSLALRSSYHSLSHGCDATNPRLKSVNPSFCLPVPSRARRLPRMPSTTPKQATRTHTHTQTKDVLIPFPCPSLFRQSMHASKQPSPRTPPETGYVQLVGSNLDGLQGLQPRPPPSQRPRLASPHRKAVRMGGAPAAATTRAPDFPTPLKIPFEKYSVVNDSMSVTL